MSQRLGDEFHETVERILAKGAVFQRQLDDFAQQIAEFRVEMRTNRERFERDFTAAIDRVIAAANAGRISETREGPPDP